jgi:hypothetical protein
MMADFVPVQSPLRVPNHVMIDHLWAERRKIQTVTAPAAGRFAASIRSLMDLRNH